MFLTGFKILFDGYLTMVVNNSKFLCDCHVTGKGVLGKILLIISTFLCDGYVTGRQITPQILFDVYLTKARFLSEASPYQVRFKPDVLSVLFQRCSFVIQTQISQKQ